MRAGAPLKKEKEIHHPRIVQSLDDAPSMVVLWILDPITQLCGRFTNLIPIKTTNEWFSTGETHIVVDVLQSTVHVLPRTWLRSVHLLGYMPVDVVPFSAKASLA